MMSGDAVKILNAAETASPTYGVPYSFNPPAPHDKHDIYAEVTGSGAVSATVEIEKRAHRGARDCPWAKAFTITLNGTGSDVYTGTLESANGAEYRAKVTSISGTSAKVSVWMTD